MSRAQKRKSNAERGCRDAVKQNFMLAICKEIDEARKKLSPTAKRLPKGFLQGIVEKNRKRGVTFITFNSVHCAYKRYCAQKKDDSPDNPPVNAE